MDKGGVEKYRFLWSNPLQRLSESISAPEQHFTGAGGVGAKRYGYRLWTQILGRLLFHLLSADGSHYVDVDRCWRCSERCTRLALSVLDTASSWFSTRNERTDNTRLVCGDYK